MKTLGYMALSFGTTGSTWVWLTTSDQTWQAVLAGGAVGLGATILGRSE